MKNEKFYTKYFKDKKITFMGLGGFGRGLKEAEFLAKSGADLIITDRASEEELAEEVAFLKEYTNITFKLGGHDIEDFRGRDLVLYANSVPLGNKYIQEAKESSKIVTKSVALLFYILQQEMGRGVMQIGVTGTKGKSTVTEMMISLFQNHFAKKGGGRVFSVGNIRGSSNLPVLEDIKKGDCVVGELDSWLLQGFGDLKISPHVSLFTNFFNDHQNYYHSMETYFLDKSYIFKFQKEEDMLVCNVDGKKAIEQRFDVNKIRSKRVFARHQDNPVEWKYSLPGGHNHKNFALIIACGKELGISEATVQETCEKFEAVEGRMQKLPVKKGIFFYNDNNSTTPESTILTIAALKKEYPQKKIYYIGGGTDKEFDFTDLAKVLEKKTDFSYLFDGTGTDKIVQGFTDTYTDFEISDSMEYSFKESVKKAENGDALVLLSPGAASFGVFKNEYDRNDQFLELFEKL